MEKPTPALQKHLKIEVAPLFKALARVITDVATTKWENLGNDFVDASAALGLKTQPEELAYLLVHRALAKGLFELTAESINQFPEESLATTRKIEEWESAIESEILYFDPVIDLRFLEQPSKLELVNRTKNFLSSWLQAHGFRSFAAKAVTRRLGAYFTYAIHHELGRNRKHYDPLLQAVDSPVAKAASRESDWEAYAALLQRQSEESVFDEPFSLREIYIPLRACHHVDSKRRQATDDYAASSFELSGQGSHKVVDLYLDLSNWAEKSDRDDAIRIISGGPGSGKSAFLKIFAADLAEKGIRLLLIPLHLIDPEKDIVEQVGVFARQVGALGHHPLDADTPEPNLLLIFDGLDELASQGRAGFNAAREFVDAVQRLVSLRNLASCQLRALISGRELSVQENEALFQHPGQILDLLPYYVNRSSLVDPAGPKLEDPENLLAEDLRDRWWQNYAKLTGRRYTAIPRELSGSELEDITSQPLLNYLVALSFTRGRLKFNSNLNLNRVYADLIEAVHERGYERGRTHASIKHMNIQDFTRVLEEIGLAAWHGDGRTTTVAEIKEHCKASGLSGLLTSFQEGAERGVTKLLAAFFFRRYGQRSSGEQTFVFTHKSFSEYLTARRIVVAGAKIARDHFARESDPDEGRDEKELLEKWARCCGPSAVSPYLLTFIQKEVLLHSEEEIASWHKVFEKLFASTLRAGLPMERLQLKSFKEEFRQSRNAEEAMLAFLNACASAIGKRSEISFPTESSMGTWLRRVQEQRLGPEPGVALRCLSYMILARCELHIQDLYGANLSHSDLSFAMSNYGVFGAADLSYADLTNAHFPNCNFEGADLRHADLNHAFLEGSSFRYSTLTQANFTKANLSEARISLNELCDANYEGATKLPRNVVRAINKETKSSTRALDV